MCESLCMLEPVYAFVSLWVLQIWVSLFQSVCGSVYMSCAGESVNLCVCVAVLSQFWFVSGWVSQVRYDCVCVLYMFPCMSLSVFVCTHSAHQCVHLCESVPLCTY